MLLDITPKTEEEYTLHPDIATNIIECATHTIAHTIFFGDYGTGKNALAKLLIAKHFNVSLQNLYKKSFITFEHGELSYSFSKSNYHFEINVQNIPKNHQHIIAEFILDISKTMNIFTHRYKIIILNNAEFLSRNIQHQLRRMMEMYNKNCRIILITHNISNIDETIQSRCIRIGVPCPSKTVLSSLVKKIVLTNPEIEFDCSVRNLFQLIDKMDSNVNKIVIYLYALKYGTALTSFSDANKQYADKIWTILVKKNAPIAEVRKVLSDITTSNINYYDIFRFIINKLSFKYSSDLSKLSTLLEIMNYHFYLYEIGYKKHFQLEGLLLTLHLCMKNSVYYFRPLI